MKQSRQRAIQVLLVVTSVLVSGCAKPVTEPRERAEALCAWHPDGLPEKSFTSDVCSIWPDGDWGDCCIEHDIRYWCGGTSEQRARADESLRRCVAAKHSDALARSMWLGVRIGGAPWLPFPWRWGYGRPWPTPYLDPAAHPEADAGTDSD